MSADRLQAGGSVVAAPGWHYDANRTRRRVLAALASRGPLHRDALSRELGYVADGLADRCLSGKLALLLVNRVVTQSRENVYALACVDRDTNVIAQQ